MPQHGGQNPVVVHQCGELQISVMLGEIVDIVERDLDSSVGCQNRIDAQIICDRVTRVVYLGDLVRVTV